MARSRSSPPIPPWAQVGGAAIGAVMLCWGVISFSLKNTWAELQAAPEKVKTTLEAKLKREVDDLDKRLTAIDSLADKLGEKQHDIDKSLTQYAADQRGLSEDVRDAKEAAEDANRAIQDVRDMLMRQQAPPPPNYYDYQRPPPPAAPPRKERQR